MVVLRCPYCGKKIRQDENFCSHCGKEIDKPHIDDVDSAFQDIGGIMVKIVVFVILWFILLILLGIVTYSVLGISNNHLLCFVLSIVLTPIVYYGLKKMF